MFNRILVPLDGSHHAEAAIPAAARIARAMRGTVILMRSVEPLTPYGPYLSTPSGPATTISSHARDEASGYLAHIAESETFSGVHTEARVMEGPAAESILKFSETENADLIVMSAHGSRGVSRWRMGGVAQHVVRHAITPVLLLNAPAMEAAEMSDPLAQVKHALIPLDGSALAETAIPPAIELLAALAPRTGVVHLLHVIDPDDAEAHGMPVADLVEQTRAYLERVARQLRSTPTEHLRFTITTSVVVDSDAAERIVAIADPEQTAASEVSVDGYDVIVMATHGRTGILRWALGSIAERVLQTTKLPMLTVRPVVPAQRREELSTEHDGHVKSSGSPSATPEPSHP